VTNNKLYLFVFVSIQAKTTKRDCLDFFQVLTVQLEPGVALINWLLEENTCINSGFISTSKETVSKEYANDSEKEVILSLTEINQLHDHVGRTQ
jgi:hypothetical protein